MLNLRKGAKFWFFSTNHSDGHTFHSFQCVIRLSSRHKLKIQLQESNCVKRLSPNGKFQIVEDSTINPLEVQTKVDVKLNLDIAIILAPIF